jgi:hypothetical protein
VTARTTFIAILTAGLLAVPLAASAQPAGKAFRLGTLNLGAPAPVSRDI